MHWDDLRIFLAVARLDSLSRAGKFLRVDPATVGRRIQRLEEDLSTPLFAKSPQGYALTDDGLRLMQHVERAEQSIVLATEETSGREGKLTGQVRIGAPDGCANYLLPQVCSAIVDEHPGLEVQIVALPRVFNLSKREADMAIAVSQPTTGRLTVQRITDYQLQLAAAESYLKASPAMESVSDLRGHRMIGYIPDMIFDKELDYLAQLRVEHVDLASNSVSVQTNLVRQGAGIGILHRFAIPFAQGVRTLFETEFSLTRSFYLIRHADDRRVERLNRFSALLVDGLRQEVARLEAQA